MSKKLKPTKGHEIGKIQDLRQLLDRAAEKYGDKIAFEYKKDATDKNSEIIVKTFNQFKKDAKKLSTIFLNMGLEGKRVAVIGNNSYSWCVTYMAVVSGDMVTVPLDKALPDTEIKSLIKRSKADAVVFDKKYVDVFEKIRKENKSNLQYYICMDDIESANVIKYSELMQKGEELVNNEDNRYDSIKIDNKKMSIMLFTSGTTAMSKAVKLSHKNIVSNLMDIASVIKLKEEDVMLSFLPLHHTFESTVGFLYPISKGCKITFCDGIRHIAENIKEYKITAMISVPALYEGIYKQVVKAIKKQGKWEKVQKGVKISNALRKIGIDVRAKLFNEIHQSLGEDLRLMVAGGAALDPEIEKGYTDLGFCVYQGYGLTETSPVIAAEDDKYRRLGSIGKAFPSVDVKIFEPNEEGIGELIAKAPSVMLGYYNNEEATKEAIDEQGWFHTGDLAKIDKDGYIFITGRKKYVIVLQNGKNIFPEELEALVNKIEGVKESFVYGRPDGTGDYKICAKIVYDKELVKEAYNVENAEDIKETIWQEVKKMNKAMPAYKYIRDIIVTDKELIKTTTQKIKRHEEMKTVL